MSLNSRTWPRLEQVSLVLLRTLVGWHFLYEGYFKVVHPAWSRDGAPLAPFSAAAYLQSATGPFADVFHALAQPGWLPWVDGGVALALVAAGLMLMLGVFTQLGCAMALALLSVFYLSNIPLEGVPQPRAEGTYLVVNKTLIELAAVGVLSVFRTGRIAGLDLLLRRRPPRALQTTETTA